MECDIRNPREHKIDTEMRQAYLKVSNDELQPGEEATAIRLFHVGKKQEIKKRREFFELMVAVFRDGVLFPTGTKKEFIMDKLKRIMPEKYFHMEEIITIATAIFSFLGNGVYRGNDKFMLVLDIVGEEMIRRRKSEYCYCDFHMLLF